MSRGRTPFEPGRLNAAPLDGLGRLLSTRSKRPSRKERKDK